jgi:hypothetical protein
MECDRCGAERPRTGPCPECGAPAPGPFGSSRGRSQAGGQSQPGGRSQPGGSFGSNPRRQSGTNWGAGASGSGRGLLSRGGGQGGGQGGEQWGDWDDGPGRGSRPGQRQSNPNWGYDQDNESRALAPYGQPMPPAAEDEIVSIPGFPMTDEEERLSGIRRPAFIPATEEKRKRKLSSWRIISGVLSIMLVCVASCAGVGFFGQQQVERFLPGPIKNIIEPPSVDISGIPTTPESTPGPAAKNVTGLVTAKSVDPSYNAIDPTSYFLVKSSVFAVITIVGVTQNQTNTLTCVWYLNNLNFNLHTGTSTTIQPNKTTNFHGVCELPYNQIGIGMVRVYWNRPPSDTSEAADDPYLAQTIQFAVLNQLPTVTPASGTSTPKAALPVGLPAVALRDNWNGLG